MTQSADDTLESARSHGGSIDVLLTDTVMPGLGGTRPDVQVIYISEYAQGLPEAPVPAGAAFLLKPFRFAALAEQLKLVARKA